MNLNLTLTNNTGFNHLVNQTNIQLDRGYLFGDGFFTTGILKKGIIIHQGCHINRLIAAAEKLQFRSFDSSQLIQFIEQKVSNLDKACIRITVTRGQKQRGYAFQGDEDCNVCIQLSELVAEPNKPCELVFAKTPISVNSFLAGTKHLNRLDNVFAANEITKPDQESLMFNDDLVICGSKTNLFIHFDDQWVTPCLENAGIEGITRNRIIKLMKEHDIPITIKEITSNELNRCNAAFVTNSLVGIWPVSKSEDKLLETEFSQNLKCHIDFTR